MIHYSEFHALLYCSQNKDCILGTLTEIGLIAQGVLKIGDQLALPICSKRLDHWHREFYPRCDHKFHAILHMAGYIQHEETMITDGMRLTEANSYTKISSPRGQPGKNNG